MTELKITSTPRTLLRLLSSGGALLRNTMDATPRLSQSIWTYFEQLAASASLTPNTVIAFWGWLLIALPLMVVYLTLLLLYSVYAALTAPLSLLLLLWLAIQTRLRNS